jgi:ornithine carbamoyltransferase
MKRDFLAVNDLSAGEIRHILEVTAKLKQYRTRYRDYLDGKNIGLLFQKSSNRTRVSFEVGIAQLGGNCIYLAPHEIRLGVREATQDVARTLSRYLDGVIVRANSHVDLVEMAKSATIPVINGLSDLYHPCQGLTDIFTISEHFGGKTDGIKVAYVGDGNNVCHSLMAACAKVGFDINVATPEGYEPNIEIVRAVREAARETGARVETMHDPREAAHKADVIYSDVWVSMGQEEETEKRLKDFQGYQINANLVKHAKSTYVFMHCLPAHRGQEVTTEVIDSEGHSIIFDQAENRLHTQKSILIFLMGSKKK